MHPIVRAAALVTALGWGSASHAAPRVADAAQAPGTPGAAPSLRMPWAEGYREALRRRVHDRRLVRRLAVGLGTALAWDLADLPNHQRVDGTPIAAFRPGALFDVSIVAAPNAGDEPGGTLGASIRRWNALYPPYALDVPVSPLQEPACPAN
jgi:hypothetical protein